MKKQLLLAAFFVLFAFINVFAQSPRSETVIVFSNGDTLFSVSILKSKTYTNEDGITYLNTKKVKQKATSLQITSYGMDNDYFLSENVNNLETKKLISYQVYGYIKLGISYTSKGESNYYIKKENDVICLAEFRKNLQDFLSSYLSDFDLFYKNYSKNIAYDFKSLADVFSAYNAFKFPDKYVRETYQNKEKFQFGLLGSAGISVVKLSGFYTDVMPGPSFSAGIEFGSNYSPKFSIHSPLTFNYLIAKSEKSSTNLKTLGIDPYISYSLRKQNSNGIEIGAGLGVTYALGGILEQNVSNLSGSVSQVQFKKITFGPNIVASYILNSRLKLSMMYKWNALSTSNLLPSSPEDSSLNAHFHSFRLLFIYRMK